MLTSLSLLSVDSSSRRTESAQQQMPPQLLKSSEESGAEVASLGSAFNRMGFSDDDLKNSDTFDVSVIPHSFLTAIVLCT